FSRHAAQWFGGTPSAATHLGRWQKVVERAAASGKQFGSNVGGDATVAHLARFDGKYFVAHFYQRGPRAGELATAFVPNSAQLGAYLQALKSPDFPDANPTVLGASLPRIAGHPKRRDKAQGVFDVTEQGSAPSEAQVRGSFQRRRGQTVPPGYRVDSGRG